MDTIDKFLRRHELGLTPTAQNDARESRRHIKKLCGLIRSQVSSMSVGPLSQYGPRFAEYERMPNIPEGRAAAAVRRMTEK